MKNHEGRCSGDEPVDGCYGCELKAKNISLSSRIIPSRQNAVPPRTPDPAWERGRAGERRPDGSFMPFLSPNRQTMGVKEYGERRREVDEQVKRLKSDPNVFASERK